MAPYTTRLGVSQACALIVIATLLAPPVVDFGHRASSWFLAPIYTEFLPFGQTVESQQPIRVQLSAARASGRYISWNGAPAALVFFQLESQRVLQVAMAVRHDRLQLTLPLLRAPPRIQVLF
jgi:hypothetical protein